MTPILELDIDPVVCRRYYQISVDIWEFFRAFEQIQAEPNFFFLLKWIRPARRFGVTAIGPSTYEKLNEIHFKILIFVLPKLSIIPDIFVPFQLNVYAYKHKRSCR